MIVHAVLLAALAAAEVNEPAWTTSAARTAGAGANLIEAGAGWPGAHVSYSRGLGARFDLGARASLNYGYEGFLQTLTGVKLQALLRLCFADNGTVSVALTVQPGVMLYFPRSIVVGFTLPVGLIMGVAVSRSFELGFGLELPLWTRLGFGMGLIIPLLLGVGLEYRVTPSVSVWLRARGGPTFFSYGGDPAPTLDAKAGVGVRF